MSQSQKARYTKTAVIAFSVLLLFWWLSPRGVDVSTDGKALLSGCLVVVAAG